MVIQLTLPLKDLLVILILEILVLIMMITFTVVTIIMITVMVMVILVMVMVILVMVMVTLAMVTMVIIITMKMITDPQLVIFLRLSLVSVSSLYLPLFAVFAVSAVLAVDLAVLQVLLPLLLPSHLASTKLTTLLQFTSQQNQLLLQSTLIMNKIHTLLIPIPLLPMVIIKILLILILTPTTICQMVIHKVPTHHHHKLITHNTVNHMVTV